MRHSGHSTHNCTSSGGLGHSLTNGLPSRQVSTSLPCRTQCRTGCRVQPSCCRSPKEPTFNVTKNRTQASSNQATQNLLGNKLGHSAFAGILVQLVVTPVRMLPSRTAAHLVKEVRVHQRRHRSR